MVSRWRIVIGGESAVGSCTEASSGTCVAASSSRLSLPSSRSSRTVAAVKLLVIEAIRKTEDGVGVASSPTRSVPMPRLWISSPSRTIP